MPNPLDLIRARMAEAEARGLRIVHGSFGIRLNDDGCVEAASDYCCPLGAVSLGAEPDPEEDFMVELPARLLGVPTEWADGFWNGFDSPSQVLNPYMGSRGEDYRNGYRQGRELRLALGEQIGRPR